VASENKITSWVLEHPYYFYFALFICGAFIFVAFSVNEETRDFRGRTQLHLAAEAGDLQQVISLLDDGVATDSCDDCQWTPLMYAAQDGFVDIVRVLLNNGADVNAVDKGGYTSVMLAAGDDRAEVIDILVDHGAKLDAQDNTGGWTALIWASKEGHIDSVNQLVAAGADQNLKDRQGKTALAWAEIEGHRKIVLKLK